jgi:hypothetical protein
MQIIMKQQKLLIATGLAVFMLFLVQNVCVWAQETTITESDRRATARALNIVFSTIPEPQNRATPFLTIVLRFEKPASQWVYVEYAQGQKELREYSIDQDPTTIAAEVLRRNPKATDREIAAAMRVRAESHPIDTAKIESLKAELRALRLSPLLQTRIPSDEYHKYDVWVNSAGFDSVHYSLTGPFYHQVGGQAPTDDLVKWMDKFRSTFAKTQALGRLGERTEVPNR